MQIVILYVCYLHIIYINMATSTRATIGFQKRMMKKAKAKADFYGVSFPEYIRHLVLIDIKEEPVYYLSDEAEKAVIEGRKEYREGKTTGYKDGTSLIRGILNKKKR
jgi:hypothetical protein